MENVSFYRATLEDLDKFLEIEKSAALLKTYSAITEKNEAKKEIENNFVYLIKIGDEVVGSTMYEMKNKDCAYLSGLIVSPRFRRRGIARQAIIYRLNELKNIKRIEVLTHPHNSTIIKLYLSFGFIIESWKDNYYGDGEPRIMLSLTK